MTTTFPVHKILWDQPQRFKMDMEFVNSGQVSHSKLRVPGQAFASGVARTQAMLLTTNTTPAPPKAFTPGAVFTHACFKMERKWRLEAM